MKKLVFMFLAVTLLFSYGYSIDDARLLRYPDINTDVVVFVYAGDIWTVPAAGGNATRLTSHEGLELFPKISPDKKWIAFSAEYPGTRQIFVIPINGGTPKQLTYYNDAGVEGLPPRGGYDHIPLDWTKDSKKILIRANRTPYDERAGKYFLVSLDGGLETPLQIPEGGFGSFSPDQNSMVYTPISREFRTWKRSKGGRAADVWTYDLINDKSERITKFPGTDQHPLWYKDKLYFVSDRDLKLNFWSYDLKTKKFAQVTKYNDYDVMWPAGHNGLVAFEKGGFLYKLNLDSGKSEKISVNINFDNPNILPYFKDVSRDISVFGSNISPSGKRVVFDARGDIFTVPAKKGITYNLTRTQGIREMYPVWSPDGKWIAYESDKTGDYEFYLLDPKTKKSVQVTSNHKVWKYPPIWSPDSSKLLFYDKNQELQILDINSKKITLVDRGKYNEINDAQWSYDSKWLVYSATQSNRLNSIFVYSLADGKTQQVTDKRFEDYSPTFSKNGKFIYFISDRNFDMSFRDGFSTLEFDFVYNKTARIFALALTKDGPKLFEDKNDEEAGTAPKAKPEKTKAKKKKSKKATPKAPKGITIDFDGIQNRILAFPMPSSRYGMVQDLGDKLLYLKEGKLFLLNMKTKKSDMVIAGLMGGSLSADGKMLLYRSGRKFGIIPVAPNQKVGTGLLDLSGLTMKIDPRKEWKQIYYEGWKIYRDWFYAKNMHGVDWEKMRDHYAKLLPYVSHRADLDYIFGELIGELNAGHTYVNWGDFKKIKRIDTGLLGADFKADTKSGRYQFAKIFAGENWENDTRSPLTEYGVNVKEGDYLISLNGYNVTTKDNPYRFLENTAGKKIEITVNSKPEKEGARTYWIKTIKSEYSLRTMDLINARRAYVDKLSGGKIGYIFVPNTAVEGNRELFKGLYAYNDKQAFIIDDRYNQGGWSPGKMIEKLAAKPVSYWQRRNLELRPEPFFSLNGPKVMLINSMSSSGGDNFPFWFRERNLGILIGTRTWGGLIGYGFSPDLVDGPSFAVPMTGITNTDGELIVEGVGVYPDEGYEVYDIPEKIAKGEDPSIEVAVKYLLDQLDKNPPKKPVKRPEPDRSKWFEKEIK